MFPVRFRQNQSDELAGGFIDDYVPGVLPSRFPSDDSGGDPDESDSDSGGSGADGES